MTLFEIMETYQDLLKSEGVKAARRFLNSGGIPSNIQIAVQDSFDSAGNPIRIR